MNRLFTRKTFTSSLIRGLIFFSIMILSANGAKAQSGDGWDFKNNTLTISTDKGMNAWRSSGSGVSLASVYTVIIEKDVTTIDKAAFQNCTYLTTVTIGTGVTTIGEKAFEKCTSLKSIDIPANVTTIKDNAFEGCTQLDSVKFNQGLTTLGECIFDGCSMLKTVTFPNTLTDIKGNAFLNSSLTNIEVKSGGTFTSDNGVLLKGNVLYSCPPAKENYTIPGSVTEIGPYAFQTCNLTNIEIPASVTKIEGFAFSNYTKMTSMTFRGTNTDVGTGIFGFSVPEGLTIYVPVEAIDTYKNYFTYDVEHGLSLDKIMPIPGTAAKLSLSDGIKDYLGKAFTVSVGGKAITDSAYQKKDTTITITLLPGYTTTGWKYNDTPLTPTDSVMTFKMPETDVAISASIKLTEYTITYMDTTSTLDLNPKIYTVESEFPIALPKVTKDGYLFKGWYTNEAFNGDSVTHLDGSTLANQTFYAKWSKLETIGNGETKTVKDDGATVKTDGNNTAEKITLQVSTVTFEEVKTEKTEISANTTSELTLSGSNELGAVTVPANGSLTLRAAEGGSFTATTVTNNGTLVDSTGTITTVTGTGALTITPPTTAPQIPYNSSSLALTLTSTEGATSKLQKQVDGTWEDVGAPVTQQSAGLRNTSALRSSATVMISEAGTYRVIVTKTNSSVSTTLFTQPFSVTKGTPPYVPPVISTYYTVTLPEVEGATLSRKAGNYTVEEGYSLTFTITLDAAYSESVPVVTTDRGETIEPDGSGRYRIRNVEEDIIVSITGIVRNIPTAIETVESGTKVWAANGTILVRTSVPQRMQVFSLAGSTVISRNIPAGDTRIEGLTAGLYIVRLSDGTIRKVAIRK